MVMMMAVSVGSFAQKFGHIDTEKIMEEMPEYQKAKDSLTNFASQLQKEIDDKQKELQRRVLQYQQDVQAKTISPEIAKKREEELYNQQSRVADFQQTQAPQMMQEKENALIEPLVQKVKDAIEKVSKANNYTYVFDSAIILQINGGDDLSPLVRKELGIAQ